jgi:hypothetical protein
MSGGHGHGHSHDNGPFHENPHAGQGSVLLDIGGEIGALVVTMPSSMLGEEIEVLTGREAPAHNGHSHRPHVAVVARPASDGTVPSLVFPELVEGSYALVPKGTDDVHLLVDVRGGEVTTASWPG